MENCKNEEEQLKKERGSLKYLFSELYKSELKIYLHDNPNAENINNIKNEMKKKYTKMYNECEEVKDINSRIQIKRTRLWKLQNKKKTNAQINRRNIFLRESLRMRSILL